jgi:LysM repeat protein
MSNASSDYNNFVTINFYSSSGEGTETGGLGGELDPITEIFQQQTQSLAEGPKKTKFTPPVIMTAQEAGNEAEAIKRDLEELEDVFEIFDLENRMRVLLEQDFPAKEEFQILYEKKILPLMAQIKGTITQHDTHFAAQAAASKGKAAQAGLQALKNLTEKTSVVQNSNVSVQAVFLIPEEGVVFKRTSARAKEEEHLVNEMFGLMSKQAVVGTFDMQSASAGKFGLEVSEETRARGFTPDSLSGSPELKARITDKLSITDRMILEQQESTPKGEDSLKEGYEFFRNKEFQLKLPGEEPKTVSFGELQRLHLAHQLPDDALISPPNDENSISIHDLFIQETEFAKALGYIPALHSPTSSLYFCPKLRNPTEKTAYDQCEKFRWSYTNEEGDKVETDFKTIHALKLQGRPLSELEAVITPSSGIAPTAEQMQTAVDVKWKIVTPELMQIEKDTVSPLTGVQAKPFIAEMILMKELNPIVRNNLLSRLTPNAEFNAILTGELQMMDLHSANLGVIPESNEEYERYKNIKFSIPSVGPGEGDFKTLVVAYLDGKVSPDTVIKFNEGEQEIQLPLKNLPELQKALDVRWEFVLFDTDIALSESNVLQIQRRGAGDLEYLIPLRSVLLQTGWKDQPLSDEVVQRLMKSDERDLRVDHWVKREDAPIYKRLSKHVKEDIQHRLAPYIKNYDLTGARWVNEKATVKDLRTHFVGEVSQVNTPELLALWNMIEDDLSHIRVRQGDTWESLARRYQQDVGELMVLNPGGLHVGEKLKIKNDISSDAPEAAEKRASIAAQLFPRITQRQQDALFERQHARNEYLSSIQALSQSTSEGAELVAQLKEFVQKPETPLPSQLKGELLKFLVDEEAMLLVNSSELLDLKRKLCENCRPSYFNMMKAMYPMLADVYELNQHYYKDDARAGKAIGHFADPINVPIKHYYGSSDSTVYLEKELADALLTKIEAEHPNAAFSGFSLA